MSTWPEAHLSRARRIAHTLVRAAGQILPAAHQRWATAMLHETAYVGTDSEAVRWAVGCLYAACVERARALYLLDYVAVRIAAALLASFRMLDAGMPTLLTLAYRGHAAAASTVGAFTPGDDYRRLVPLMDAMPLWLHGMVVLAVVLYALAARATWRRQSIAGAFWCTAIAAEQLTSVAARPILSSVGVVVVEHPSVLAAVLLPIVLPILFAMAAWSGTSATSARSQ